MIRVVDKVVDNPVTPLLIVKCQDSCGRFSTMTEYDGCTIRKIFSYSFLVVNLIIAIAMVVVGFQNL